jgi:putative transposase
MRPKGGGPKKLLSPTRRRAAVEHVRWKLGVSERRACRAIEQPRSSQRYVGRKARKDWVLAERLLALSRENPRYGYRRAWALLRREGWKVNKKRIQRLWREEGLKVPGGKQRKRRRLAEGGGENGCTRKRAGHKDHVWSYDFVMDRTEDGRTLKMMPIVDEYSRECLSIKVERSITSEEVVKTLAALFARRGEPAFVRSDNGPEFIAKAVKGWLENSGVGTLYIEPGSPWENAYSETFISRFGDELLKREVFSGLLEAKVLVEEYRNHYNHERPHSALGYLTPAEFAASCEPASTDEELRKELESVIALS